MKEYLSLLPRTSTLFHKQATASTSTAISYTVHISRVEILECVTALRYSFYYNFYY